MKIIKPGLILNLSCSQSQALHTLEMETVGIYAASWDLSFLLFKPGLKALRLLNDLKRFMGWSGALYLDLRHFDLTNQDDMVLISPFDGSRLNITGSDLMNLIGQLNTDGVFFPVESNLTIPKGLFSIPYVSGDEAFNLNGISSDCALYSGEVDWPKLMTLCQRGFRTIHTDTPIQDACKGRVYSTQGIVNLLQPPVAHAHHPIDNQCKCPTCAHPYSLSYLHHLFHATPLLCHRLLIQHNCYSVQNHLRQA